MCCSPYLARPPRSANVGDLSINQKSKSQDLEGLAPELLDDPQSMVGVIQTSASVGRGGDDVLDADSEPACEINPWFHREAHAWHERLLFTLDHVRRLVSGYPDSVTGAMDELLAIPGVPDHAPGGSVAPDSSLRDVPRRHRPVVRVAPPRGLH
jgi:hypothetical protein